MSIGNRIKILRKSNNLSQCNLANLLNVHQSTIANYEKDIRTPNIENLILLADILNITVDELIGHNLSTLNLKLFNLENDTFKLSDHFLDLILNKRLFEAKKIMYDFYEQRGLVALFFNLFRKVLTKVGWLWEIEAINISDEHYVSYEISKMITHVTEKYISEKNILKEKKKFIGMAVKGEKHNIGLKMLLLILDTKGYQTHYIGEAVPISDLRNQIEKEQADVLILSITSIHFHDNIKKIVANLTGIKIAIAGIGTEGLVVKGENILGCFRSYEDCMEALL